MEPLHETIRKTVLRRMDLSRDLSDEEILSMIMEEICTLGKERFFSLQERMEIQRKVFHSLRKLDVLQDLLEDDTISEIMVNGPDCIFVEREGQVYKTEHTFSSGEKLEDVVQKIVAANNKVVNAAHPIVDTKLSDGSRINIVLPPVALDHCILSIRKFPKKHITMDTLVQWKTLSEEVAEFVGNLVRAHYNIVVSGATSSGKTTFLNAMAEFIPGDERVVTIEDSAELQLLGVENLVRLEAREATMEGKLEITIRDLVRTALRMRPDRIIVGECRGKEALEVLQSFGTGHDGSFSTGHANSAKDMISRLETMALMAGEMPLMAIRSQIASGVDIIIHLGRLRDKSRKLLQIMEVEGIRDGEVSLRTIYEYREHMGEEGDGTWVKKDELLHQEKMKRAGL
ncbi:MAG: CpaF family protein [Lachnospiraceae bacterium]|nr:CpaF family protein [Lachnospiraceae bacterium]